MVEVGMGDGRLHHRLQKEVNNHVKLQSQHELKENMLYASVSCEETGIQARGRWGSK